MQRLPAARQQTAGYQVPSHYKPIKEKETKQMKRKSGRFALIAFGVVLCLGFYLSGCASTKESQSLQTQTQETLQKAEQANQAAEQAQQAAENAKMASGDNVQKAEAAADRAEAAAKSAEESAAKAQAIADKLEAEFMKKMKK
jgi:cell division protein FtsB